MFPVAEEWREVNELSAAFLERPNLFEGCVMDVSRLVRNPILHRHQSQRRPCPLDNFAFTQTKNNLSFFNMYILYIFAGSLAIFNNLKSSIVVQFYFPGSSSHFRSVYLCINRKEWNDNKKKISIFLLFFFFFWRKENRFALTVERISFLNLFLFSLFLCHQSE